MHTVLVRGDWGLQEEASKVETPLLSKAAREALQAVEPEDRAETVWRVGNKKRPGLVLSRN